VNEQKIADCITEWVFEKEKHKSSHFTTKFEIVVKGTIVVRDGKIMRESKETTIKIPKVQIDTEIRLA